MDKKLFAIGVSLPFVMGLAGNAIGRLFAFASGYDIPPEGLFAITLVIGATGLILGLAAISDSFGD